MEFLLGLIAGALSPIQTSVNGRLRRSLRQPLKTSLISFCVGLCTLILILTLSGQGIGIPWERILQEPFWVWLPGLFGVIYLTGNILVLSKIGSAQTVIFTVIGQIFMGLFTDHFGLFHTQVRPLNAVRVAGALFVLSGIVAASCKTAGNKKQRSD